MMFNSDTTGDLHSQLREARSTSRSTKRSSAGVQTGEAGNSTEKKSRRSRVALKPKSPKPAKSSRAKKPSPSRSALTPEQRAVLKDVKVTDLVKSRLVQKAQQVQNKTQEFASVEHLSADAAAMFVDSELSTGAMHRARLHLVHCSECRDEINRQRATVDFVRSECRDDKVTAPMDLKAKLAGLANECTPGPGAEDLAMQRPESFVAKVESVVRAVRRTQGR